MTLCKVHALKTKAKYPTIELSITFCGMSGTQERNMQSEYTTMDGRDARFEVSMYGEPVTCRRCATLAKKEVK